MSAWLDAVVAGERMPFWGVVWTDQAIKGLVVLALAAGVAMAMRRSAAAARHLVWSLALASLLALPVMSLAFQRWRVLPPCLVLPVMAERVSHGRVMPVPPPTDVSGPESFAADRPRRSARSAQHPEDAGPHIRGGGGASTAVEGSESLSQSEPSSDVWIGPELLSSEPASRDTVQARRTRLPWGWILAAWLGGVGVVVGCGGLGRWSLWRLSRSAKPVTDASWGQAVARAAGDLGIRAPVLLLQCSRRSVPMVWGVFRPKLILPEEADTWPAERRRVVLLHELAHVTRRDCLWLLVSQVACALYWYNPFVWWAARRRISESERACDDVVLRAGSKPSDYAECLLQLASELGRRLAARSSVIAMARPSHMEGRLLAILDRRRRRRPVTRLATVVALVAAICIVLPLAAVRAALQPESDTESDRDETARWSVVGRVTGAAGHPMAGVEVRASCGIGTLMPTGRTTTDARGRYVLSFGPGMRGWDRETGRPKTHLQAACIFASKSGFYEKNLCRQGNLGMADERPPPGRKWGLDTVLPNKPYHLDFVMVPAATIRGRLLGESGQPMVDTRVYLDGDELPPACGVLASARTDEQGRFAFHDVPCKSWWFELPDRQKALTSAMAFSVPGTYEVELVHETLGDGAERLAGRLVRAPDGSVTPTPLAGDFVLDKDITCRLMAGTAEHADVVEVDLVRFKTEGGRLNAVLRAFSTSWVDAEWVVTVELMGAAGDVLARGRSKLRTLCVIEGGLAMKQEHHLQLGLGQWADLKAAKRFAVSIVLLAAASSQAKAPAGVVTLSYVDDSAEGKRSLGASGHAVRFERPDDARFVEAVEIFASRYGSRQAPKEDFHVYVLNDKQQILADVRIPYRTVERTRELRWYMLRTPSIEVPETFHVALNFNPHQTKGIYLGYDEGVKETHSLVGLPGDGFRPVDKRYDWMVRVQMSAKPSGKRGVKRLADWKPTVSGDPFAGLIEGRYDDGTSDGRQSYGGAGPMIRFELADVLPKGTSSESVAVAGVRLYASRYGSGYDPETTTVRLTVRDDKEKVVYEQDYPYALLHNKPKWVDLALTKPLPLRALGPEARSVAIALDPDARRTKGVYFHYNKQPPASHSFAIGKKGTAKPVPDREWMIRIFLARQGDPKSSRAAAALPARSLKHFYCAECDAGFSVPVDEARELLRDAARGHPDKPPLVQCPQCKECTCRVGVKCAKCGRYFALPSAAGSVFRSDWRDRCPKCGYSTQRERAVRAAFEQKRRGMYDPNKLPEFIRKAVEEAERNGEFKD